LVSHTIFKIITQNASVVHLTHLQESSPINAQAKHDNKAPSIDSHDIFVWVVAQIMGAADAADVID
jgi:hypothetical protein